MTYDDSHESIALKTKLCLALVGIPVLAAIGTVFRIQGASYAVVLSISGIVLCVSVVTAPAAVRVAAIQRRPTLRPLVELIASVAAGLAFGVISEKFVTLRFANVSSWFGTELYSAFTKVFYVYVALMVIRFFSRDEKHDESIDRR